MCLESNYKKEPKCLHRMENTSDGKEVGKINRFILDPETQEVTHVVVEKGWLLSEDKVVPFDKVRSVTEDKVVLNEDINDFNQLPPFEETHFIRADHNDVGPGGNLVYQNTPAYYWYPTQRYPGYPAYGLAPYTWPPTETKQNIPANTIALKEGTNVMSSDGQHVGDVERLFVEPNSNRSTHFLISQGVFFKDHKLVSANWIRSVTEDKVQLNVPAKILERLPSYKDT